MIKDHINNRGTRGIFVNPTAGLMLRFHLNPTEIEYNKPVNYEQEPITGYHTGHVWYTHNDPLVITFDLFFDAGHTQQSQIFNIGDIGTGTMGVRAILESFLYPQEVDLIGGISAPSLSGVLEAFKSDRFYPPPDIYFIWGLRWYRGKLASAPVKEKNFGNNLVPKQLETNVSITCLEDGVFQKFNDATRKGLAVAESAKHVVELPF